MKYTKHTAQIASMPLWESDSVSAYLLLDCADEHGSVAEAIKKEARLEVLPLYIGTKDEADADIGPHLVKVSRGSALLQWFFQEGAEYGIILFSEGSLELLGNHLRPYLECIWPDDQRKMFRFYDPMTFYYFFPSLVPDERALFLGPACGAACIRPACALTGDALLVENTVNVMQYSPPRQRSPWFLSESSFEAFEIPAGHTLARILADYFEDRYADIARGIGRRNVFRFAREVVRLNRETHQLTRLDNIKAYLAQVAELGIGYREDPQFWKIAQATAEGEDSFAALQALMAATDAFRAEVWGESGKPYTHALQRVLETSYEAWDKLNSIAEVADMLAALYPERAAYCGRPALVDLVKRAQNAVREWNWPLRPGIALCAGLMFFLGADYARDPLHPWFRSSMGKNAPAAQKMRDLFAAVQRLTRLELQALQHENQQHG